MTLEEVGLSYECFLDGLAGEDILLGSADHTNVSKFEWIHIAIDDIHTISALVHQINLGQNSDGSLTMWVHLSGELERV